MKKIDRMIVYDKCDGKCGYCGRDILFKEMQVDHMIPRVQNGTDDMDNLMPACRKCNHYKRGDTVGGFRRTMLTLHSRLEKIYINNVAVNFGMIDIKPFNGVFYFETIKPPHHERQEANRS